MKQLYKFIFLFALLGGMKPAIPQILNSHPSAEAVLFFDFDGHTVSGTSWNVNGTLYCAASGLNSAQIIEVFNRVSEDFRPFDVNVTTDSSKFLNAPLNKRIRIIVTTTSQWYGIAGGVSFVGSFSWGDDTPCFVFSQLLSFNVKNIAEACSHEAGHSLGLYHQSLYDTACNRITEYHPGQGTGEIGWAPIMGNSYYQNMSLWNNGPNVYACTNYQNDLQIITTSSGFGFRPDDYPGTFSSAYHLNFSGTQFTANGIIERTDDSDMFRFTQPVPGNFQLIAIPFNVGNNNAGSDVDLQVTLYDDLQVPLKVYNPSGFLHSIIDTALAAGTYYLEIEGRGNLFAPDYASLGSYSLAGHFNSSIPFNNLDLHGYLQGTRHNLNWTLDIYQTLISQTLEVSDDGAPYITLIEIPVTQRSYSYRPSLDGMLTYRLRLVFDSAGTFYSNSVTLNTRGPKTELMGNIVQGSLITLKSDSYCNFIIFDYYGRLIMKGRVHDGLNFIQLPYLLDGAYIIRFKTKTHEWAEKFFKRNFNQ